ncbi:MAG: Crp/Fnr family transcriptional regulator [Solirubrobacteraceae bacterium]
MPRAVRPALGEVAAQEPSRTHEPPPARLRRCCVLEEVPGLQAELPPAVRPAARRAATAAIVSVAPGEQPIQEWYGGSLHGPGLLVLHGTLAREVHVAGRTATELLGPGDLLRPWDVPGGEPVPSTIAWRVLAAVELALLDAFFADRTRPFPQIAAELMSRCVQRAESLAVQRAIACHPRVDMRVAMLLWHLAGRYGYVRPDGRVQVPLPLTHRLVGELIGAERPSVSHAFGRLSRAGLVLRARDGWLLSGTPEEHAEVATRPLPPH